MRAVETMPGSQPDFGKIPPISSINSLEPESVATNNMTIEIGALPPQGGSPLSSATFYSRPSKQYVGRDSSGNYYRCLILPSLSTCEPIGIVLYHYRHKDDGEAYKAEIFLPEGSGGFPPWAPACKLFYSLAEELTRPGRFETVAAKLRWMVQIELCHGDEQYFGSTDTIDKILERSRRYGARLVPSFAEVAHDEWGVQFSLDAEYHFAGKSGDKLMRFVGRIEAALGESIPHRICFPGCAQQSSLAE